MCNDTNNFLFALRRLSPPPPANSPTAETAVGSDTLTEAGYARSNDENRSTVIRTCVAGIILISGRFCEYTLSDDAMYIAMLPVQVLLIVSPVWVFCANDAVNCNRMSEWRTI